MDMMGLNPTFLVKNDTLLPKHVILVFYLLCLFITYYFDVQGWQNCPGYVTNDRGSCGSGNQLYWYSRLVLASPAIPSGIGRDQANTVYQVCIQWDLINSIRAMS